MVSNRGSHQPAQHWRLSAMLALAAADLFQIGGKSGRKVPFSTSSGPHSLYLVTKTQSGTFYLFISTHRPSFAFTGVLIFINILWMVDLTREWCQKAPAAAAQWPRCETYASSVCMAGNQSNTGQDSHSTFIHFQFMTTSGTLPTC